MTDKTVAVSSKERLMRAALEIADREFGYPARGNSAASSGCPCGYCQYARARIKLDNCPSETNVRQEALQEWRDSCHCGCDACVALIETLELESGAVKASEPARDRCPGCGLYAPAPGYPCGCCGRIGTSVNGDEVSK